VRILYSYIPIWNFPLVLTQPQTKTPAEVYTDEAIRNRARRPKKKRQDKSQRD
jgi:hypothetical protein